MKRFGVFFDRILNISAILSDILLVVMGVVIVYEVVSRTVFGRSVPIVDFCQILVTYIPFLGAAWLLREEGHAKVLLIYERLPKRAQATLIVVTSIFGVLIGIAMLWFGVLTTQSHIVRDIRLYQSALGEPLWIYLIIAPICGLLIMIQFLRRALHSSLIRKKETQEEIFSLSDDRVHMYEKCDSDCASKLIYTSFSKASPSSSRRLASIR